MVELGVLQTRKPAHGSILDIRHCIDVMSYDKNRHHVIRYKDNIPNNLRIL